MHGRTCRCNQAIVRPGQHSLSAPAIDEHRRQHEVQGILADDGLDPDERLEATGSVGTIAKTKPKDVVLDEAVHVVSDEIKLLQTALPGAVKTTTPTARAAISRVIGNVQEVGL